jgi:glutathione S-transferase
MNIKAVYPGFKVWAGGQADIERADDLAGMLMAPRDLPVGKQPCMADAMFAPVCSRFTTYT